MQRISHAGTAHPRHRSRRADEFVVATYAISTSLTFSQRAGRTPRTAGPLTKRDQMVMCFRHHAAARTTARALQDHLDQLERRVLGREPSSHCDTDVSTARSDGEGGSRSRGSSGAGDELCTEIRVEPTKPCTQPRVALGPFGTAATRAAAWIGVDDLAGSERRAPGRDREPDTRSRRGRQG